MALLSVIVLTCNQRHTTLRYLQSAAGWLRRHNADAELLIVDNGSADGTMSAVMEFADRESVGNLRLIRSDRNIGVSQGRNLALEQARGDVLMFADNDTLVDAATYEALRRHVLDNPGCGIAAPALYSPDGLLQHSAKPYPSPWIKIAHVLRPGRETARERAEMRKPHPWYVIGASQTFRRDVLDRVGGLDAKIFYGPEDADFCHRVRRAGYTVDYLPDLRLIHDWRRATRRSPLSPLGRRHGAALLRFWAKTLLNHNS